ncbi:hypothetical protein SIM22_04645 [Bacillus cereus group sp. BfR-BA-01363]|uniref:hypothetical protein n=1 Tax=Bacillus cereus group sp. BfR-BA-01363 TaxID=3094882 RepID=UPI0029C5192B|nr:hypothetical protein [Bacillus cereus group sp. BfR-BA-01363]MDX5853418.1 hypothetical protein [Bacillus cereus group sp. BfR-BA-01363]
MLLKQLHIAFEENNVLRDEYPPNLFIPMLEAYIQKEIHRGYDKICPIRFSKSTGLPEKECIRLFLGLSDNDGLIDLRFYVRCPNCNEKQPMNLDSDEEFKESLFCKGCMKKMKFSEEEIKKAIKLVFNLNKKLFLDESSRLKNTGEAN